MELKGKTTTILDLHIEVLDLVFGELRQLKDKVNFARVHPILREVFVYHSRNRFKTISLQDIKKDELSFILKWCGTKVISVTCENDNGELTREAVRLAGDYCPNLENLDIFITAANVNILEENMKKLKNLKEIEIYGQSCQSDVNVENLLRTFQELPHLKSLSLDTNNWQESYLKPLNNLTQLKYLDIWRLEEPEEIEIFSNLWENLTSLTIETSPEMFIILSELCVKLKILEMRDFSDPNEEGIGYFPKLKHLDFNYLAEEGDCFGLYASSLSDKYNNQLESLVFYKGEISTVESARRIAELRALKMINCYTIASNCIEYIASIPLEKTTIGKIEKEDLLLFLRECRTLKLLRVGWIVDHENDFVNKLLDILEANGVQPDKPFVLKMFKSRCDQLMSLLNLNSKAKLLEIQCAD